MFGCRKKPLADNGATYMYRIRSKYNPLQSNIRAPFTSGLYTYEIFGKIIDRELLPII